MSARKTNLKSVITATVLLYLFCSGVVASDVILNPSSRTISAGDTFTVDVFVVPDTEITGIQFDIEFDSSLARIEKVEEGDLFRQSGMSTIFNEGLIETGMLRNVYGCVLGNATVSTAATFATITLSLEKQNSDSLTLDLKNVIISDSEGNSLETVSTGVILKIVEVDTSQTPGDFDHDTDVDFDDFVEFAGTYHSEIGDVNYNSFFDFDNDSDVDFDDFVEFAGLYEN